MPTRRIKHLMGIAVLAALVALAAVALGLAAREDDEPVTAETETIRSSFASGRDLDSQITDRQGERASKSCGGFRIARPEDYPPIKVEVVEGHVPCRVALGYMKAQHGDKAPEGIGSWSCDGPEGLRECVQIRGPYPGTIRARFYCRDWEGTSRARCRERFGSPANSDREAGVHFSLDGRVLTARLLSSAPTKTRDRVRGERIRATCGQGFTGSGGDPRQTRTRLWPAGETRLTFRFPRDISRVARWCRLEDPVVGHVAFVMFR